MTTLDDHDVMFVDFIYTPMEPLNADAIDRRAEWRSYNERAAAMGPTRLHVLVVVDNADALGIDAGLAEHIHTIRDIEVTPVIYRHSPSFELQEIDEEGRAVDYDPWGTRIVSEC
jgi:hypothetical protein